MDEKEVEKDKEREQEDIERKDRKDDYIKMIQRCGMGHVKKGRQDEPKKVKERGRQNDKYCLTNTATTDP